MKERIWRIRRYDLGNGMTIKIIKELQELDIIEKDFDLN